MSFDLVFQFAIGKKRARHEAGDDRSSPTKKAKKALAKSVKQETVEVPKKTKPSAPSKANGKSLFFYKTVVLSQGAQLSIQSWSPYSEMEGQRYEAAPVHYSPNSEVSEVDRTLTKDMGQR